MKKLLLLILVLPCLSATAHDLWLSVIRNPVANQLLIRALVAESFPDGQPVTDRTRFIDTRASVSGLEPIFLTADPSDSTILGSVTGTAAIITATVSPREISFGPEVAGHYFMEEIGMTEGEMSDYLTPGVEHFEETYTRYLKLIAFAGSEAPEDSSQGLPLEIVMTSWERTEDRATIRFRVLHQGIPLSNIPVRFLTSEGTVLLRTDVGGNGVAVTSSHGPLLLAHIRLTKLSETRFRSEWTNLALYSF